MESNNNEAKRFPWKSTVAKLSQVLHDTSQEPDDSFLSFIEELKPAADLADKKPVKVWQIHEGQRKEVEGRGEFIANRAYIVVSADAQKYTAEPIFNIHIWLSKNTSAADYMAAVQMLYGVDSRLDHKRLHVRIHREIALHESDLFHSYFTQIAVLKQCEESKRRLLQFHAEKEIYNPSTKKKEYQRRWMVERKFLRGNLRSDDVFLLIDPDHFKLYQWNGSTSNDGEKSEAARIAREWKWMGPKNSDSAKQWSKKPPKINIVTAIEEMDDHNNDHGMYALFPTTGTKKKERRPSITAPPKVKRLYRLRPGGKLLGSAIEEQKVCKSSLNEQQGQQHVFLLDTDVQLFAWIPVYQDLNKSKNRFNTLLQAEEFLKVEYSQEKGPDFHQSCNKPITVLPDGLSFMDFDKAFQG